ncbi:MAG: tetratricopeptide repeat protein [Cyanobacteria bacterium P01_A01_bin.80]
MIYCINPKCQQRQNNKYRDYCQACGTSLIINNRYRILQPLRELNPRHQIEIFEVADGEHRKVMKVLKNNNSHLVELLEREASALQVLKHPGIPSVELNDFFTFLPNNSDQELYCLVMEKVAGENLEEWVEKHGCISQNTALNYLEELINILDYIHENGVLHRDIKPSNIMRKPDGKLVLIDFGSIREITDTYLARMGRGSELTGVISAGYTPIEQINGKALPQSDYYALGRTLVYLVTGKQPGKFSLDIKTGRLLWHNQAPQILQPVKNLIDELINPFAAYRPANTKIVIQRLNRIPSELLRWKLFNSPLFKIFVVLLLGILTFGTYNFITDLLYSKLLNDGYEEEISERFIDAKKIYESAIKLKPRRYVAYNNLGRSCQKLETYKCAEENFQKALELKPKNPTVLYNLGDLYDEIGDYKRALQKYNLVIQSESEIKFDAMMNIARIKNLQGRFRDAEVDVQKVKTEVISSEEKITQSSLFRNIGWSQFGQKRYNDAINSLEQAIKIDNELRDEIPAPYCLKAQIFILENKKKDAYEAIENCMTYQSSLPEVKEWREEILQSLLKGEKPDDM